MQNMVDPPITVDLSEIGLAESALSSSQNFEKDTNGANVVMCWLKLERLLIVVL